MFLGTSDSGKELRKVQTRNLVFQQMKYWTLRQIVHSQWLKFAESNPHRGTCYLLFHLPRSYENVQRPEKCFWWLLMTKKVVNPEGKSIVVRKEWQYFSDQQAKYHKKRYWIGNENKFPWILWVICLKLPTDVMWWREIVDRQTWAAHNYSLKSHIY